VFGEPLAARTPSLVAAVAGIHIAVVTGQIVDPSHSVGGAGELLGINPNTLRYKMRKLGIPFGEQRKMDGGRGGSVAKDPSGSNQ
jgi:hypothetical protein